MAEITVERYGNRIHLHGWVGPSTPDKCKSVGGGRFSREGGPHWTYPLEFSTCLRLREVFGSALRIGPELNAWAREQKLARQALIDLASQSTADLLWVPKNAPTLDHATANRTYQRVAVAFGARVGSFALCDQPGLGKSIEVLGTIIETAGDTAGRTQYHLIFAPSTAVRSVWQLEVAEWLDARRSIAYALDGTLAARQKVLAAIPAATDGAYEHVFIVTNIEAVRIRPVKDENGKAKFDVANALVPALFDRVWDTVVIDESHRALIRRSGTPSQQRAGFAKLRSNRRIACSGTPMRGKPEQLWGTLNWLRPDLFSSYWNWVGRYWKMTSNGFSNYVLDGFQIGGEDRLSADLASIMLRRTKGEVLSELPPKQYAGTHLIPGDPNSPFGVWLRPSKKHLSQIQELSEQGSLVFDDGEVMVNGPLPEYTRKKQLASALHVLNDKGKLVPTLDSPKFEWLVEKIEELDGERIVVASQFTQLIDVFAAGLRERGIAVHVLTGKTPMKQRDAMRADFQSDSPTATVFMLNTQAGGVALTLDKADYLVLLDETTVPDDQEQVEDRIHRTSRIHNVTIYYLRTLGTQDEEVAWIAAARESVQKYILDGARGVEYARDLYEQSANKVGSL